MILFYVVSSYQQQNSCTSNIDIGQSSIVNLLFSCAIVLNQLDQLFYYVANSYLHINTQKHKTLGLVLIYGNIRYR